jgi:hypothetical protein
MSFFGEAINQFSGIAGKFYRSGPALRARAIASHLAYAPKLGMLGAGAGAVAGGVAGGRDHRLSGAMAGAGLGSLAGVRGWSGAMGAAMGPRPIRGLLGAGRIRGRANPIGARGPWATGSPDRLRIGAGGPGGASGFRSNYQPTFITQKATKLQPEYGIRTPSRGMSAIHGRDWHG